MPGRLRFQFFFCWLTILLSKWPFKMPSWSCFSGLWCWTSRGRHSKSSRFGGEISWNSRSVDTPPQKKKATGLTIRPFQMPFKKCQACHVFRAMIFEHPQVAIQNPPSKRRCVFFPKQDAPLSCGGCCCCCCCFFLGGGRLQTPNLSLKKTQNLRGVWWVKFPETHGRLIAQKKTRPTGRSM